MPDLVAPADKRGLMTAKEYLSEIRILKWHLKIARETASNYHISYSSMHGIDYSADKVQTTPKNAMEEAAWRMMERREEAVNEVSSLTQELDKRLNEISSLEDPEHIGILYERYYVGKGIQRIAEENNKDPKTIKNILGAALREFQRKYKDTLDRQEVA